MGAGVRIATCCTGSRTRSPVAILREHLSPDEPVLLALDAPLGWAAPLGQALQGHRAGLPLDYPADALFKRATDMEIRRRYGKSPLEIGANLISRTAVAALTLLRDIAAGDSPIPLAWHPDKLGPLSAIEVYPAVTRLARGAPDKGGSLEGLSRWLRFDPGYDTTGLPADAIDAAVCVLAAADFIQGSCTPPEDLEQPRKEGWIWAPGSASSLAVG